MPSDVIEQVYEDLYRLMFKMAIDAASESNWRLGNDEIYGELCVELVEVCEYYNDKPLEELKSLVVTSMRNRVADIRQMCFYTHRSAESDIIDIDGDDFGDESGYEEMFGRNDPAYFDLHSFIESLGDDARQLVLEILWPNERTRWHIDLFVTRRQETYSSESTWSFKITKLLMARSLGWSRHRLSVAWNEVKSSILTV